MDEPRRPPADAEPIRNQSERSVRVVANVLGLGRDANGSFAARVGEAPGQDLAARGIAEADVVMRGESSYGVAGAPHAFR